MAGRQQDSGSTEEVSFGVHTGPGFSLGGSCSGDGGNGGNSAVGSRAGRRGAGIFDDAVRCELHEVIAEGIRQGLAMWRKDFQEDMKCCSIGVAPTSAVAPSLSSSLSSAADATGAPWPKPSPFPSQPHLPGAVVGDGGSGLDKAPIAEVPMTSESEDDPYVSMDLLQDFSFSSREPVSATNMPAGVRFAEGGHDEKQGFDSVLPSELVAESGVVGHHSSVTSGVVGHHSSVTSGVVGHHSSVTSGDAVGPQKTSFLPGESDKVRRMRRKQKPKKITKAMATWLSEGASRSLGMVEATSTWRSSNSAEVIPTPSTASEISKMNDENSHFHHNYKMHCNYTGFVGQAEGGRLHSVVSSENFDILSGLLIVSNAVVIGLQTHTMAEQGSGEVPRGFRALEIFFCIAFAAELLLRVEAFRWQFFKTTGIFWGVFDILCVVMQVMEEILNVILSLTASTGSNSGGLYALRVMRMLRLIRILRVVRIIRYAEELQFLVVSIMNSMRSLFWTLVLLVLCIYIVSVYFTELVLDYRLQATEDVTSGESSSSSGGGSSSSSSSAGALVEFYGGLGRSMLSLYQAMSGGVDWDDLCKPLINNISPLQGLVFVFYIAFTVLALTNVVTGVFVDGALKSARQEQDDNMVRTLCEMFEEQGITRLSISTFKQKLFSTEMQAYLESIGVDTREANILYELLDGDGSGSIDYEEFIGGCMRLRGSAKAIDVMYLLYETRHLGKTLSSHFQKIEGDLARVAKLAKLTKQNTMKTVGSTSSFSSQQTGVSSVPQSHHGSSCCCGGGNVGRSNGALHLPSTLVEEGVP